jgi:hypothetical protein
MEFCCSQQQFDQDAASVSSDLEDINWRLKKYPSHQFMSHFVHKQIKEGLCCWERPTPSPCKFR